MGKIIIFKNEKIVFHNSWKDLLTKDVLNDLERIESKIGNNYTPSAPNVLRFLKVDLKKCKYVILGQDPYPQPNIATGRAFEVGNITNWGETGKNVSLRNILKLLHKNQTKSSSVQTIKKVRDDIKDGEFKILPPNLLFENWENQGVLLLNTSLTCEVDKSNSHSNYWACFTQEVIDYIVKKQQNIIWLLWGKNAQSFGIKIRDKKKLKSDHPRLHNTKDNSFYYENHFKKTKKINWYGIQNN